MALLKQSSTKKKLFFQQFALLLYFNRFHSGIRYPKITFCMDMNIYRLFAINETDLKMGMNKNCVIRALM